MNTKPFSIPCAIPALATWFVSCLVLLSLPVSRTWAAEIVAKADAIEMTAAEVRSMLAAIPEGTRATVTSDPKALEQYVRSELARRSLTSEIRASGFEKNPVVATQLDRLREEALLRLWVADKARPPATFPSEDEVKAAYESNKAAFATPTEYRIAQIFISAPNGADAMQVSTALAKAADIGRKVANSDFAALARTSSDHAESAAKGGDLGFLPENRLLQEVAAAVRTLSIGQTVGPVKTAQGLHFLKLTEKKAGAVPEFATIKESIAAVLRQQKGQQLEQAYLNELGTRLGITINQIELAKLQPTLK